MCKNSEEEQDADATTLHQAALRETPVTWIHALSSTPGLTQKMHVATNGHQLGHLLCLRLCFPDNNALPSISQCFEARCNDEKTGTQMSNKFPAIGTWTVKTVQYPCP